MSAKTSCSPESLSAIRGKLINMRVNEEEYRVISEKARASGMTKSDLLRGAAQNAQITHREDVRQVILQLAAIGNNHNQIAHQLNTLAKVGAVEYGPVSAEELAQYLYGVREALLQLRRALP